MYVQNILQIIKKWIISSTGMQEHSDSLLLIQNFQVEQNLLVLQQDTPDFSDRFFFTQHQNSYAKSAFIQKCLKVGYESTGGVK